MRLTVFTPTYNRKELIKRAYESLRRQSRRDFSWLVVDDGSTDGTEEYIRKLISEHEGSDDFEISYYYCENGGKMRAHNRGAEYCKTEWFLCLDSDDMLTDDAVETIYSAIESLDAGEYDSSKIAGIVAHKGKSDKELLSGVEFPEGIDYTTLYGLYLKGFKGETTLVLKTSVLREYPFPEIDGEKYVPEDYIYDKIDANYVFFVLPRILTVCEIVSEGYTASVRKLKDNNVMAWYLYYEQRARITPMSVLKLKYLGFYRVYARKSGNSISANHDIPWVHKLLGIPGELWLKLSHKE